MKKCPVCERTYADDSLTFCLEDGAALAPAFDPQATLSLPNPAGENLQSAQTSPVSRVQTAASSEEGREVPSKTTPAARASETAAVASVTPTPTVAKGIARPANARQTRTVVDAPPESADFKLRRFIVWASIAGFLATCFLMFVRFFLPRSIFEPATRFRIGFPDDYAIGVDDKWQQQYRIWVDKTPDRLFVIYARCTHLGCTPDWKASENKFKCPCHGSGYDSEGINFEGPAPRPMDRAYVEKDAEGQIVVDTGKLYKWEKGGENQFNSDGSYIPL